MPPIEVGHAPRLRLRACPLEKIIPFFILKQKRVRQKKAQKVEGLKRKSVENYIKKVYII
jgi:hypothetical protein